MQGPWVWSLVWENPTCPAPQLPSLSSTAPEPQLLSSRALQPVLCNERSHCDCYSKRSRKQTQKDSVDSGVQFIIPAGLRQSFLLSQGPQPIFVTTFFYTQSVHVQAHVPKSSSPKSTQDNISKRYNQIKAINLQSKPIWTYGLVYINKYY